MIPPLHSKVFLMTTPFEAIFFRLTPSPKSHQPPPHPHKKWTVPYECTQSTGFQWSALFEWKKKKAVRAIKGDTKTDRLKIKKKSSNTESNAEDMTQGFEV